MLAVIGKALLGLVYLETVKTLINVLMHLDKNFPDLAGKNVS